MIQANLVGRKQFFINPGESELTTTHFAAIDTAVDNAIVSPYAYTVTLREDYDSHRFCTADAGSTLVLGNRIAFGVFLTPDLLKGNLMFQVSGRASFMMSSSGAAATRGFFFFGRRATNNTIVSDVTVASNQLDKFIPLASFPSGKAHDSLSPYQALEDSIETEVLSIAPATGFAYCFGYAIECNHASTDVLLRGLVHVAMRKDAVPLSVHRPRR